jgi:hypothetical protein
LHGHEHRAIEGTIPGPQGGVPVHGISSATNLSQHPGREASFSIYDISQTDILRTVYRWNGTDFVATLATSATSAMAG